MTETLVMCLAGESESAGNATRDGTGKPRLVAFKVTSRECPAQARAHARQACTEGRRVAFAARASGGPDGNASRRACAFNSALARRARATGPQSIRGDRCHPLGRPTGLNAMPRRVHGHATKAATTRTYRVWSGMRSRCSGLNSPERYADRGIRMCGAWESFERFLEDMGEAPEGHSIDRIDNDGDYTPQNCRWATSAQQANNRSNCRVITHAGESLTLSQWAERAGCSKQVLSYRLRHGMPMAAAISTPVSATNRSIKCR